MKYTCPVCGYNELEGPPANFEICPSCHTEFGYDDIARSHEELRGQWIAQGLHWSSPVIPAPPLWDPYEQLKNIGVHLVKPTSDTQDEVGVIEIGGNSTIYQTPVGEVIVSGVIYAMGRLAKHMRKATGAGGNTANAHA